MRIAKRFVLIFLSGIFLLTLSCGSGGATLSEAQQAQIVTEVTALADEMIAGVMNLDIDQAFAMYHPTDFRAFNQQNQFGSATDFKDLFRWGFENSRTWHIEWTDQEVVPAGPRSAFYQGTTIVTQTLENGRIFHYPRGYVTLFVEKGDRGWAITRFHQSWAGPVFPPGVYATTIAPGDPAARSGVGTGEWAVEFNDNNQYTVTYRDEPSATGSYSTASDILYLRDDSACEGAEEAYYRFRADDEGLHLEALRDDCEGRRLVYEAHPLVLR